jgi:putative DNA methylase
VTTVKTRKKLIEVALPLEAINVASAREKSIRHGHPSTLHLYWARRPLAAARAVIFAQMVDDPSANPDLFPTEKAQEKERLRLFKIIEELVVWKNTTNEKVLQSARDEIWASWRRTCADNADHQMAGTLFNREKIPGFHDPFAGGGAIPLEAQRLGLSSHASDLNPVAVLINKAMIEIPPPFAGMPPINPQAQGDKQLISRSWKGAEGLAEDVSYYGQWMRDEAEQRIGKLYPKVRITKDMSETRPDLEPYVGKDLTVIAWIWVRTVKSPNPAYSNVDVPLASTFMLCAKSGNEVFIDPVIEQNNFRFIVKRGKPNATAKSGTKLSRGANFRCIMSDVPIAPDYIKSEGRAGRMGSKLMAIVLAGEGERVYVDPAPEHENIAKELKPLWELDTPLAHDPRALWTPAYGLKFFGDLFTPRQNIALTIFADLVTSAAAQVKKDILSVRIPSVANSSNERMVDADLYSKAVATYLGLGVSRSSSMWSSNCWWQSNGEFIAQVFTRQAIPMVWDYGEVNIFSDATGNWTSAIDWITRVMNAFPVKGLGAVTQQNAATQEISKDKVISTDPPYYDNIGYADLSDFYYVWQKRALGAFYPELYGTLSVPKADELVATPYRHGSKDAAEKFFLLGMTNAMRRLATQAHSAYPVTIYYAFRQSESDGDEGTTNTGWDTFLAAVIDAGFSISGTWPIRTERPTGVKVHVNALASSIVLVCRPRPIGAPIATQRDFVSALNSELPVALGHLQEGNIAPVDLAQAAIGPGMAIYTRYAKVIRSDDGQLTVREVLALINHVLDEQLAEQEGDWDADTRWACTWFDQFSFDDGEFGQAEQLARAKNTAVRGVVEAGIALSNLGKVRLYKPEELPADWAPETDNRLTVWEMLHHLIRLQKQGEAQASAMLARFGERADAAKELAYRLYGICEKKKRSSEGQLYNDLIVVWPDLVARSKEAPAPIARSGELNLDN